MSECEIDILDYIPVGAENAIKGIELRQQLEISDRTLRKLVETARREHCILNNQNGKGYYRPDNVEEVERWIEQEEHRAKSIFYRLKGAKDYVKGMKG